MPSDWRNVVSKGDQQSAAWQIVEASFVAAAQAEAQLPALVAVELAFAGRSNVGKSSLLNCLMGRKRLVRTSSTPGCTRQINFFHARARDGAAFHLVDLPGYGYAKRSKGERSSWAQLIEQYLGQREWLRAVVLLVDARRGLGEEDQQLAEFVRSRDPRQSASVILVATKVDKIPKSKRKAALKKLAAAHEGLIIPVSSLTGEGMPRLWKALREAAHVGLSND